MEPLHVDDIRPCLVGVAGESVIRFDLAHLLGAIFRLKYGT